MNWPCKKSGENLRKGRDRRVEIVGICAKIHLFARDDDSGKSEQSDFLQVK